MTDSRSVWHGGRGTVTLNAATAGRLPNLRRSRPQAHEIGAAGHDDGMPQARDSAGSPEHVEPVDDRLVDSPTELEGRSVRYVFRKVVRECRTDQCTDLAAALTYYSVLAIFPAALALTSLLGLVGQGTAAVDEVLGIVEDLGGASIMDSAQPTIEQLAASQSAGLAMVLGLAGALWAASAYVDAFGRAMNRIYEIDEGRPIWKRRPMMLLLTVVLVVLTAAALAALVLTGPVAEAVGDAVGLGSTAVLTWQIAKWPMLLIVVIAIVALLYYATPNLKQPTFRWVSIGAFLAIVIWALLSVAFGFYVANFSSYDRVYGALAGVIVFLLWLWLTNLALLLGAELNSELERARELQGGIPAEETLRLPPRDTSAIEKAEARVSEDLREGRELRRGRSRRRGRAQ
jgi:membrane protein